jgi:hypothetical protein
MSKELRQALSSIPFPETKVYSNRYEEYIFKPGQVVEYTLGLRPTPESCVFAEPDAIKRSPIHFEVRMGGGGSYVPVYEGQDITDNVPPQILAKLPLNSSRELTS